MTGLLLAAICAAGVDPAATLTRVLVKVREDLRRIPNYTCVETVTRVFYTPKAPVSRDCEVMLEMKKRPTLDMMLRPLYQDRVRLEVAMAERGEMHALPGAARFEEQAIDKLVPQGPMGTGMFGSFLNAVFVQDVKRFRFEREVAENGRELLEYSFEVAPADSRYKVKMADSAWVYTGYGGSVRVDRVTEEVAQIRVETAILPPAAWSCRTTTEIDLAMTQIGSGRFPIATKARQWFVAGDGNEAVNTTQLAGCREYRGESMIRYFTAEPDPVKKAGGAAAASASIPAGLSFATELLDEIRPEVAAAGDPFVARLRTAIRDGRTTLAPAGSRVEGRLLRVQVDYPPKEGAVVVLRPESVEVRGVKIPLAATHDLRKVVAARSRNARRVILLPFQWETDAALLRFEGKGAIVPRKLVIDWRTVAR